jgi:microcystin-dependent protein
MFAVSQAAQDASITNLESVGTIPTGMVAAFDLASCPADWSPASTLQGRTIIGVGSLGWDSYVLGETGGEARHTLRIDEMPSHNHTGGGATWHQVGAPNPINHTMNSGQPSSGSIGFAGGGQAHENRPPFMALLFCKKD